MAVPPHAGKKKLVRMCEKKPRFSKISYKIFSMNIFYGLKFLLKKSEKKGTKKAQKKHKKSTKKHKKAQKSTKKHKKSTKKAKKTRVFLFKNKIFLYIIKQ